jgi:hypothetical protein
VAKFMNATDATIAVGVVASANASVATADVARNANSVRRRPQRSTSHAATK